MEINSDSEYKLVKWGPQFEIGIPVIDGQHKRLVELCDNLYKIVMNDRESSSLLWREAFVSSVKECVDYCLTHFHDEEILMQAAGYAELENHKASHKEFVDKVKETVKGLPNANIADCLNFVKFLHNWIYSHIAFEDKLYYKSISEYIRSRGKNG